MITSELDAAIIKARKLFNNDLLPVISEKGKYSASYVALGLLLDQREARRRALMTTSGLHTMNVSELDTAIVKARELFNLKPYASYKVDSKYVSSYNNLQDLIIQRDSVLQRDAFTGI